MSNTTTSISESHTPSSPVPIDIQGNPMASTLGDPKGARASWDRAEALAQAMQTPAPALLPPPRRVIDGKISHSGLRRAHLP